MIMQTLKKIWLWFMDFLYPRDLTCVLCHSEIEDYNMCKICLGSIQFNRGKVCRFCGRMIMTGDYLVCSNCKMLNRHFDGGTSVVLYDDFIKKAIFNLKYHDKRYIAHTMAILMVQKISDLDLEIDFDYIIPVPLHFNRFKQRGFNQAELIAKEMSFRTGIKLWSGLKRIKETPPLNKLCIGDRQSALFKAFALNGDIQGNIILVDDIFTTGTTLNTCSEVLKQSGAHYILITTFSVGE